MSVTAMRRYLHKRQRNRYIVAGKGSQNAERAPGLCVLRQLQPIIKSNSQRLV